MTTANERTLLKMVFWTVLDLFNLIFNRTEVPGLTALHQAHLVRNSFGIGLQLGAVANTWSVPGREPQDRGMRN